MPYLILQDYFATIQDANLQQILCDNDAFRLTKQETALTEIRSYLVQKYDVSDEFRETVKFSFTTTYKAKQLVYLDADAYSATATYALNALTLYLGNVYYCSTLINTPEAFTLGHWTLLGAQYAFFYIPTPYPEFDYKSVYNEGDFTYWKNKVYKCNKQSVLFSQSTKLQYGEYENLPGINQFPDATGQTQWSTGVDYSLFGLWPIAVIGDFTAYNSLTAYVTGDRVSLDSIIWQAFGNSTGITPGTDITKWIPVSYVSGDNRNPQLVEMCVMITIYKLSPRITPYNVPDVWVKNYDGAISWLKKCAKGEVTLDAPLLQLQTPTGRIRWGSQIKNINNY